MKKSLFKQENCSDSFNTADFCTRLEISYNFLAAFPRRFALLDALYYILDKARRYW